MFRLYTVWTAFVLTVCFMREGMSPNNLTRLLILIYLVATFAWYWPRRHRSYSMPRWRFVLQCSLSALVVEFCYMFSRPVFSCLLYHPGDSALSLMRNSLVDFAFTFPAYLVIFSVFWRILQRYRYSVTEYVILFSMGQALGDGNAFFLANPGMLLFLPYVMLNYQAINIIPYLKLRPQLGEVAGSPGWRRRLAPLLWIPLTYWCVGAAILVAGRRLGFS